MKKILSSYNISFTTRLGAFTDQIFAQFWLFKKLPFKVLARVAILFLALGSFKAQATTVTGINSISATQTGTNVYGTSTDVTYTVSLATAGSGSGSTTLSINWSVTAPTGVSFSPVTIPLDDATPNPLVVTFTITSDATTPAGNYNFTLSASGAASPSTSSSYTIDPAVLRVGLVAPVSKVYDGTTNATLAPGNYSLSGIKNGDNVTLNNPVSGTYNVKNAGTGRGVTVTGLTLSGSDAGNYSLNSTTVSGPVGIITPAPVTASLTGTISKTYDGTTDAILGDVNYTLTGVLGSDVVALNSPPTGTYDDKNAGTGKTVTSTGLSLSGADAANYSLTSTTISGAIGTIVQRPLTITGAPATKVYDGNASSSTIPTISGTVQTGDVAAFIQTYDTKSVGTLKTLTPSGIVNDGNGGNNYTYTFASNGNGDITPLALTVTLTGTVSKVYDGTTSATLTPANYTLSGVIGSDDVTLNNPTDGNYNTKNVGSNKNVTVTGLAISGADASNYTVSSTVSGNIGIITRASTSIAVTSDNSSVCLGAPVTFTATVTVPADAATGSVRFFDGTTIIGTSTLSGNVATLTVSNLPAGANTITATYLGNSNYITSTSPGIGQDINAPVVTYSKLFASSCGNGDDGAITLNATGSGPFSYSWTGVGGFTSSSSMITGLAVGDYTVVVTDLSSTCSITIPNITIKTLAPPTVEVTKVKDASCLGNDGSIRALLKGGYNDNITPAQYSLSGAATYAYQNSGLFTGLVPGNYTVTAKDSKGCTATLNFVVNTIVTRPLTFKTGSSTMVSSCGAGNDGTITTIVAGGVPPYHYSLNGVEQQVSYNQYYTFTGLQANVPYMITVTDNPGCGSISQTTTLQVASAPVVSVAHKGNETCVGANNGFIAAGATGGIKGYMYSLNGGTYQTANAFYNLSPGNYMVTVKDARNCTNSIAVTISAGSKACAGKVNGSEYVLGGANSSNKNSSELSISQLKVQGYPNPFVADIRLDVKGNNKDKVSLTVTDVMGRRLYETQGNANQQYKLGGTLGKGVYFVQVKQGNNTQTIKIVKE